MTPAGAPSAIGCAPPKETLTVAIDAARAGPPPEDGPLDLPRAHAQDLERLRQALAARLGHRHEKTKALAVEPFNDWDAIFRVLHRPDLPLTDNAAEQALRPSSHRSPPQPWHPHDRRLARLHPAHPVSSIPVGNADAPPGPIWSTPSPTAAADCHSHRCLRRGSERLPPDSLGAAGHRLPVVAVPVLGKATRNRVLCPLDATLIVPPCASTIDLTIASPNPAPSP